MDMKKGIPAKIDGKQYILEFKSMPLTIGMWNGLEKSWVIATPQCSVNDGSLFDCCYENEWVNDEEIVGWMEV